MCPKSDEIYAISEMAVYSVAWLSILVLQICEEMTRRENIVERAMKHRREDYRSGGGEEMAQLRSEKCEEEW